MKKFLETLFKTIILFIVSLMLGIAFGCSSEFDFPTECEMTNQQIERDIRVLKSTNHWTQELEDELNKMRCEN